MDKKMRSKFIVQSSLHISKLQKNKYVHYYRIGKMLKKDINRFFQRVSVESPEVDIFFSLNCEVGLSLWTHLQPHQGWGE